MDNGLRLRIKKFSFTQPSVELLGHFVHKNGLHDDYQKVAKVRDAILPTTRKELRSLLGFEYYYGRFIPGFAKIAQPLNGKISEKVKFL